MSPSIPQDQSIDLWDCAGIYCLYVESTGDFYIGSTVRSFRARWANHIWGLRHKKHHCRKIQVLFDKYGPDSVQLYILEIIDDKSFILEREQVYLDEYFNTEKCCNLCPTAGSCAGYKMTPEQSQAHAQRLKGRIVTEETRKKIAEKIRESHTPERRQKTIDKVRKTYPGTIVSPNGEKFKDICNLKLFCEQHGIGDRPLRRIITGERPHHKGWTFIPPEKDI